MQTQSSLVIVHLFFQLLTALFGVVSRVRLFKRYFYGTFSAEKFYELLVKHDEARECESNVIDSLNR